MNTAEIRAVIEGLRAHYGGTIALDDEGPNRRDISGLDLWWALGALADACDEIDRLRAAAPDGAAAEPPAEVRHDAKCLLTTIVPEMPPSCTCAAAPEPPAAQREAATSGQIMKITMHDAETSRDILHLCVEIETLRADLAAAKAERDRFEGLLRFTEQEYNRDVTEATNAARTAEAALAKAENSVRHWKEQTLLQRRLRAEEERWKERALAAERDALAARQIATVNGALYRSAEADATRRSCEYGCIAVPCPGPCDADGMNRYDELATEGDTP